MSQTCTYTCDACGRKEDAESGNFGWGRPVRWLTVGGLGPIITADMPHEHARKQPDLCSWTCVAAYAAQFAPEDVRLAIRELMNGREQPRD